MLFNTLFYNNFKPRPEAELKYDMIITKLDLLFRLSMVVNAITIRVKITVVALNSAIKSILKLPHW